MRKKIAVAVIFACAIALVTILFVFKDSIFADESGSAVTSEEYRLDLDGNGRDETVRLATYISGDGFMGKITISESYFVNSKSELTGFEDNIRACDQPIYDFGGQTYLCITGEVGVHSRNLELLKYQNGEIFAIPFKTDDGALHNIVSDVPNFIISEKDGTISADNRNYDLDPIKNAIRSTYGHKGGEFTFSGIEDIIYNEAS